MIRGIRHRGLNKFYEIGSKAGIRTSHATRLRMLLAALDTSQQLHDMDVPGFRLHALSGRLRNRWSVTVNGNWRLTFEFRDGDVYLLAYEDYH